jgi:O-antigen ligase
MKESIYRIAKNNLSLILIGAILISLPLKNIYISISIIAFVVSALASFKIKNFYINKTLLYPILFFALMLLSVFWTKDINATLFGLQKLLPLAIIPIIFAFLPQKVILDREYVFRYFSYAMVLYGVFYILRSTLLFAKTDSISSFFYLNLVPPDPGLIYVSVFASFALFYFVQLPHKKIDEKIALFWLVLLLFLLSSKSIITIDFIIICCYYIFFSNIPKSTKFLTIISVFAFLFFSLFYVKETRDRFLIEFETAFVDNTPNHDLLQFRGKTYNVSLKEAWTKKDFHQNNYFPSIALRVYQTRIFKEMLREQDIFFTGFGLEASQPEIAKKTKEHNLFYDYAVFNFHNQYVQTFAEIGFFGVLILILMLGHNIKNAVQNKDFLHIAFAITMLTLFLSESFFCRQRGIMFFIILYCLFNCSTAKPKTAYAK